VVADGLELAAAKRLLDLAKEQGFVFQNAAVSGVMLAGLRLLNFLPYRRSRVRQWPGEGVRHVPQRRVGASPSASCRIGQESPWSWVSECGGEVGGQPDPRRAGLALIIRAN
jgi:hypothetical protein